MERLDGLERKKKMWYRYGIHCFNLEKVEMIKLGCVSYGEEDHFYDIYFWSHGEQYGITYSSKDERDAEFEKICKLLGLEEKEHISRCC